MCSDAKPCMNPMLRWVHSETCRRLTFKPKQVKVKIKRLLTGADLPLPQYESSGAAGMDLRSAEMDMAISPESKCEFRTGFAYEVPQGYELQIRPRSGLAFKSGIIIPNSPGTLDSDYRGELKVCLINLGNRPVLINHGDRIAQAVLCPVLHAQLEEAEELSSTERGEGGFGSTGAK